MNVLHPAIAALKIQENGYTLRFAETEQEFKATFALRYDVFTKEFAAGSKNEEGIEQDVFDASCHHMIIFDKVGNIIATYRMQSADMAFAGSGFYSAAEFCLDQLPEKDLFNSVEIGRVCIHKDHRRFVVLLLLLKGLAAYLKALNKDILLGSCSLMTTSISAAEEAYTFFKKNNHFHPKILIPVQDNYAFEFRKNAVLPRFYKLERLITVYLKYGAKICSLPALDLDFKTIDFLTLIDTKLMPIEHFNYFFNK